MKEIIPYWYCRDHKVCSPMPMLLLSEEDLDEGNYRDYPQNLRWEHANCNDVDIFEKVSIRNGNRET